MSWRTQGFIVLLAFPEHALLVHERIRPAAHQVFFIFAADEEIGPLFQIGQPELHPEADMRIRPVVFAPDQTHPDPAIGDAAALLEGLVAEPAVYAPGHPFGGLAHLGAGIFPGIALFL